MTTYDILQDYEQIHGELLLYSESNEFFDYLSNIDWHKDRIYKMYEKTLLNMFESETIAKKSIDNLLSERIANKAKGLYENSGLVKKILKNARNILSKEHHDVLKTYIGISSHSKLNVQCSAVSACPEPVIIINDQIFMCLTKLNKLLIEISQLEEGTTDFTSKQWEYIELLLSTYDRSFEPNLLDWKSKRLFDICYSHFEIQLLFLLFHEYGHIKNKHLNKDSSSSKKSDMGIKFLDYSPSNFAELEADNFAFNALLGKDKDSAERVLKIIFNINDVDSNRTIIPISIIFLLVTFHTIPFLKNNANGPTDCIKQRISNLKTYLSNHAYYCQDSEFYDALAFYLLDAISEYVEFFRSRSFFN